jgi:hypothetical protein
VVTKARDFDAGFLTGLQDRLRPAGYSAAAGIAALRLTIRFSISGRKCRINP